MCGRFYIQAFVLALFFLPLTGCVSNKVQKLPVAFNIEDSEWSDREKILPWKNYSDNCRISRSLFKETGKSLNYYIFKDSKNKIIYLIFEDSHSISDWVNDFDYVALSYEHAPYSITAHGGFVKVWQSGSEKVMKEFEEAIAENPSYELVITGWSMGGAFAHFAAEELNWKTRTEKADPDTGKKVLLITYGCPHLLYGRPMSEYFARCVKASYNFAHVKDGFARLPPESWGFFIENRIEIGQNDHSSKSPHVRYGEKELYGSIHINDTYIQTDE
ncbi:MAG: lipase family protein [Treponema sp.]|nr:lipase family protein [Treponema sp.]